MINIIVIPWQVPLEDLQQASSYLVQALEIRKKYMEMSQQDFCPITARFVRSMDADAPANHAPIYKVTKSHIAGENWLLQFLAIYKWWLSFYFFSWSGLDPINIYPTLIYQKLAFFHLVSKNITDYNKETLIYINQVPYKKHGDKIFFINHGKISTMQ